MPRPALPPLRSTVKSKFRNYKYYSRIPLYGCLVAGILTADHRASAATTTLIWDTSTATTGAQDGAGTWNSTNTTWWNGSTDLPWTDSTALAPVIAQFGAASGTTTNRTVTVSGTVQVAGLSFSAITGSPSTTNPAYNFTSGTISFDTGGTITLGTQVSNSSSLVSIGSVLAGSNVTIQKATGSTSEELIELKGANTWTGTLTIASGNGSIFVRSTGATVLNTLDTVVVGSGNTLNLQGTANYTSNFVVAGGGSSSRGAIRFDANMTLTGTVTMAGNTVLNFQNSSAVGANVTFSQGIAEQGGSYSFTKTGAGILTLPGASTYTGSTIIAQTAGATDPGSILLDFKNSTVTDNLLYNGIASGSEGALFLTGNTARTSSASTATLSINGADFIENSQSFGGLTVSGPTALILQSGLAGSVNLSLGAITRTVAGSTLSITAPASGAITTTTNNGGLLGTWATYTDPDGLSTWAGSDPTGVIGAFTGDKNYTGGNLNDSTYADSNLGITSLSSGAIGQTGNASVNTITMKGTNADRVVTVGAGNTLTLGQTSGLQLISGARSLTIGAPGNAGTLTAGSTAGAELFLSNYDSLNTITINSVIANNGQGAVNLVVNGLGTTILTGANTYTGTTTITSGTLQIQSASALGTTAGNTVIGSGGTLALAGGITVAEPLSLVGTGAGGLGALRNVGGSNTYSGLISLAGNASITADAGSTLTLFRTSAATTVINNTANVTFGGAGTINVNSVIATSSGTLTKTDSGTLVLNAANTYTGSTSITGGILRITTATGLGTIAAGTTVSGGGTLELMNNITVGAEGLNLNSTGVNNLGGLHSVGNNTYGGKLTLQGTSRINSDTGTLNLTNTGAITGAFGLTIGGTGNTVLAAALTTGTGSLTKDGSGTLTLSTGNTYTGTTTINGGTIAMTGNDTFSDSSGLLLDGGSLAMGAFTDTVASVALRRGSSITGTGTLTTTTTSAYAFQEGSISVNLVSTPGTVGLAKTGSGTVTLSGANNYTGGTTISSGRLVLDYSGGNTVVAATNAFTLNGGTLEVKGGSTAVTLGAISTGASTGMSTLAVDANTALTATSYARNSGTALLIDLSAPGSSLAFTTAPGTVNGVVTGAAGGNAAVVMKDSTGRADFAALGTGNTIVRLNAGSTLPASGASSATSYVHNAAGGTFSLTGSETVSTLRIDTTANSGTLDLNGNTLSFNLLALLMDGSNDFTITNTGATGSLFGANAVFIYQLGTGKLTLDAQITGSTSPQTFLMGTGLIDWTAAAGNSGANFILGVTTRLTGTGLSSNSSATGFGTGVLNIGNNGILELNSSLDFTRAVGSGTNLVNFYSGGGGFSAYGADRVVNLGGAGATLTWGSGQFLASASKLILGSPYATATVDFQNGLNLNGGNQTVDVQSQNITGVGGKISGVIAGTGSLSKIGQGILNLSAANTYSGPTFVKAGTLLVSGSINGNAAVSVDSNAELMLTGTGSVTGTMLTLADNSKLSLEVGTLTTAPITLTGTTSLTGTVNLALTLTADPVEGTLFTIIDGSSPLLGYSTGARFAANGSTLAEGASFLVTTGSFNQYFTISYVGGADGNDVTLLAIPEPSTLWTLCASIGLTLGISRFRRRRSSHLSIAS